MRPLESRMWYRMVIDNKYFDKIVEEFRRPSVDLFTFRLNKKCEILLLLFSRSKGLISRCFHNFLEKQEFLTYSPFFSFILRILRKIVLDQTEGIVIALCWLVQLGLFSSLCNSKLIIFKPSKHLCYPLSETRFIRWLPTFPWW